MQSWATHELRYVQLGDARLNKRLMKMVEDFAAQPESSVLLEESQGEARFHHPGS